MCVCIDVCVWGVRKCVVGVGVCVLCVCVCVCGGGGGGCDVASVYLCGFAVCCWYQSS